MGTCPIADDELFANFVTIHGIECRLIEQELTRAPQLRLPAHAESAAERDPQSQCGIIFQTD